MTDRINKIADKVLSGYELTPSMELANNGHSVVSTLIELRKLDLYNQIGEAVKGLQTNLPAIVEQVVTQLAARL